MDIQTWLDQTVLPEQPPSPAEPRCERPSVPPGGDEPTGTRKRRRKLTSSDSSILDAPQQHTKELPITREPPPEESADESAGSHVSHVKVCAENRPSSQPYARKPRRKTRPDRYQPALKHGKERGAHTRRREGESKQTKPTSRRNRVENPGSGLAHSFHAKNVPKDRLTLRPREKLGLFNKGRASSPVKGRGLPDLVFSEMKFLQQHRDQPGGDRLQGSTKNKSKKDHTHAKEDEISAFFTSVRPALAEKDVNVQAKRAPSQKRLQDASCISRDPSQVIGKAISCVELSNRVSHLNCGTGEQHHESGGYISWSESIRAPSTIPEGPRWNTSINSGQLNSRHDGGHAEGNTSDGILLQGQLIPPNATRHVRAGSDERFRVSSLAPANDSAPRPHTFSPHASPSSKRVHPVDRIGKHTAVKSVASALSMPSSVPGKPAPQMQPPRRPQSADPTRSRASDDHLEAVPVTYSDPSLNTALVASDQDDPQTSSSLEEILQECSAAFRERQLAVRSYQRGSLGAQPSKTPDKEEVGTGADRYPTIRKIATARFTRADGVYCPRVPSFYGPSIYAQQEQRQFLNQEFDVDENVSDGLVAATDEICGEEVEHDELEWDAFADPALYEHELGISSNKLAGSNKIDNEQRGTGQERNFVTNARFWRPHKLY